MSSGLWLIWMPRDTAAAAVWVHGDASAFVPTAGVHKDAAVWEEVRKDHYSHATVVRQDGHAESCHPLTPRESPSSMERSTRTTITGVEPPKRWKYTPYSWNPTYEWVSRGRPHRRCTAFGPLRHYLEKKLNLEGEHFKAKISPGLPEPHFHLKMTIKTF